MKKKTKRTMFGCCFYVGSIYMIRPEAAGQFLLINFCRKFEADFTSKTNN